MARDYRDTGVADGDAGHDLEALFTVEHSRRDLVQHVRVAVDLPGTPNSRADL
jgi:hypothetical protein